MYRKYSIFLCMFLQFYKTLCLREFWEIEFIFFLYVIRKEASCQKVLPREISGTLFGGHERDEHLRADSILVGLFSIPACRAKTLLTTILTLQCLNA